eukprot:117740-Prorocentrum_minimum.AAC.1
MNYVSERVMAIYDPTEGLSPRRRGAEEKTRSVGHVGARLTRDVSSMGSMLRVGEVMLEAAVGVGKPRDRVRKEEEAAAAAAAEASGSASESEASAGGRDNGVTKRMRMRQRTMSKVNFAWRFLKLAPVEKQKVEVSPKVSG